MLVGLSGGVGWGSEERVIGGGIEGWGTRKVEFSREITLSEPE